MYAHACVHIFMIVWIIIIKNSYVGSFLIQPFSLPSQALILHWNEGRQIPTEPFWYLKVPRTRLPVWGCDSADIGARTWISHQTKEEKENSGERVKLKRCWVRISGSAPSPAAAAAAHDLTSISAQTGKVFSEEESTPLLVLDHFLF